MSGICQLGEDIGIDAATDVSILVLCWKLGAKGKPGHVMEAEWVEGMERLGADSADKVCFCCYCCCLSFVLSTIVGAVVVVGGGGNHCCVAAAQLFFSPFETPCFRIVAIAVLVHRRALLLELPLLLLEKGFCF